MKSTAKTTETETIPKRKVGRPPKSAAQISQIEQPRKGRRTTQKRSGVSTRDLIINNAREIINKTGVVDFRIETLAQSLSLSPGNITYHFPKKEDIIAAIWDQYLQHLKVTGNEMITSLLDIKQLFLSMRTAASQAIDYIGIVTYYYGDMGTLIRDNQKARDAVAVIRNKVFYSMELLCKNDYLTAIEDERLKELAFQSQYVMIRWWTNHALIRNPHGTDLNRMMDRYVAMSLLPLYPYLTRTGRNQFESIMNLLK